MSTDHEKTHKIDDNLNEFRLYKKFDDNLNADAKVGLSKASRENDQGINTSIILSIINQEINNLINNNVPQLYFEKTDDDNVPSPHTLK